MIKVLSLQIRLLASKHLQAVPIVKTTDIGQPKIIYIYISTIIQPNQNKNGN